MTIPCYRIDAFTDRLFSGNPAAVCPLERWLPDGLMQSIAAENNLSETAFFVPDEGAYALRWFTPVTEVALCGHATLASAWVVLNELDPDASAVSFTTQSGELRVAREGDQLVMDFPACPGEARPDPARLLEALGVEHAACFKAMDWMVVLASESDVRDLRPNMPGLLEIDARGVIVTAPGDECDFVSRFFAPGVGVPEDPVTGSAHCTLFPYWAKQLGRSELRARQISARGGEILGRVRGERVDLVGGARLFARGTLLIDQ
ncbi:MAG: PhzF family phenazine biosynthesis protein [Chlamydiales bacterium]|jgi:PhzF family phenazine biosynthesis protein